MDKPVRLTLFGTPTVAHAGSTLALPFERRSQLLVLLALRRGWVPRAEIAAMLWPEQESKLAFTNLRKTLFRLQSMPWAAALESQGNALRFEPATDVLDFEAALREPRAAEALALYRGELLASFDDGQSEAWTHWLGFERERLRGAWHAAAMARLEQGWDDAHGAIALASRLLDTAPLDEAALRAHMRWLVRAGQGGAARQAYRQFVDRLQKDLGIEPGVDLRALHESLAAATPSVGLTTVAAAAVGEDGGFVGRAVELRRITDLLSRGECRLLCLIGPGGIGKTSLARRALRELAPRFEDGALLVDLEDATAPAQLGQRIAREAGQGRGRAGDSPLAAAIDALGSRHVLLVLDNFEPLAEHASLLDRLLQACGRLKLLVTSRVRLAVAGEWSMPIEGLPFPEPEDEDRAEAFDAVRLFVQAAQRIEPRLVPASERAAIVDICRLVEGLPLAIELAAAWVRVLSCEAIAEELRRGSELLRAQDASHPQRHASIEQVFEQSWQRLSPVEQRTLARLSVFRGGFTTEAARAVAEASLPVLGALADKSLLRKDDARLHLHPLVQQLAQARLTDPALRATTQAAHAAQFHRLLQHLHPRADHGDGRALDAIDAEFENLRQAWGFAIEDGQTEVLLRSAAALTSHCEHRARFEDGLALMSALVRSPVAEADARLQAQALGHVALLESRLARYVEADVTASRALALAQRARDPDARLQALKVQGSCAVSTGRQVEAQRIYREVIKLSQAAGHGVAQALENLALVEKRLGRYDECVRLSQEALAQYRREGNHASLAMGLSNLASLCMFLDDNEQAAVHLHEALALAEREGLTSTRAFVLANLTELALKRRDWDAARGHAEAALEVAEGASLRMLLGWLRVQLARLATRRDELPLARALLARGTEAAIGLNAPALKAAALLGLAELLEHQGHAAASRRVLAFGADQEAIGMADRDELRVEWARRSGAAAADTPWPGVSLDVLLHRVVVECDVAHAPLIAVLG